MEQYKNEPVDLFVLRVLARAIPQIHGPAREALWSYLRARSNAELMPQLVTINQRLDGDGERS